MPYGLRRVYYYRERRIRRLASAIILLRARIPLEDTDFHVTERVHYTAHLGRLRRATPRVRQVLWTAVR